MNIYTSYFTRAALLKDDSKVYISIANSTPTWFQLYHMTAKELAPLWAHINELKSGKVGFNVFAENYKSTLEERFGDFSNIVKYIEDMVGDRDVVLLCWEKDFRRCHRSIVADIIGDVYAGEL